jgi:NADPH:quinone reductase-like Zn-dependent oxidoreductase
LEHLSELFVLGALKPLVSRTYPLTEAVSALNELLGRGVIGKLVLTVGA